MTNHNPFPFPVDAPWLRVVFLGGPPAVQLDPEPAAEPAAEGADPESAKPWWARPTVTRCITEELLQQATGEEGADPELVASDLGVPGGAVCRVAEVLLDKEVLVQDGLGLFYVHPGLGMKS